MIRSSLSTCLAGLLLASPALAQSDGENGSDIVVTGEQPTRSKVTRQARDITAPRGILHHPLPRFEGDRLCPGVFGLNADYASLIIDRIRANAESLHVSMTEDDGSCDANFIVAFVDHGQDVMQQIARRWPERFSGMARSERLALLAEDGPARVWTTTVTRTRDGAPVAEDPITGTKYVGVVNLSRIYLSTREDITGVLVLLDRADANGKTVFQLADYATMRGLASTRPVEEAGEEAGQSMATILTLFDPQASPPGELTAFDRAYLAALYGGLPNVIGLRKVIGVNGQLRRQAQAEANAAGE